LKNGTKVRPIHDTPGRVFSFKFGYSLRGQSGEEDGFKSIAEGSPRVTQRIKTADIGSHVGNVSACRIPIRPGAEPPLVKRLESV